MLVNRPTILRSRISLTLAAKHPRGMTCCQIQQYTFNAHIRAAEVRIHLAALVADGLAVCATEARPKPYDPLVVYIASPALLARLGKAVAS